MPSSTRTIVIMDIDGTLADLTHRLPYIQQPKPDWDSFHAAVYWDSLIPEIAALNRALHEAGYEIHLTTGRMEKSRTDTCKWLAWYRVPYHEIHMRVDGDFRPDYEIKREIYDLHFSNRKVLFAVDDRQQVVDMWRSLGLRCLQVSKGDF